MGRPPHRATVSPSRTQKTLYCLVDYLATPTDIATSTPLYDQRRHVVTASVVRSTDLLVVFLQSDGCVKGATNVQKLHYFSCGYTMT